MPDHSPAAPEVSVAAHHDLVSFLSRRSREIRSHGTLTFGVPIDGPLSVIPAHECLEMALSKLSSTYQIYPSIISRLPFYIRTMDEILTAVAVVNSQWHLKSHHTVPVVHPMWPSPTEVGDDHSTRMPALERYADAVTGLMIGVFSPFLTRQLEFRASQKRCLNEDEISVKMKFLEELSHVYKEEFLRNYAGVKIGFTYALLELERL